MPLDISSGSDTSLRVDGYQSATGEDPQTYYNRVGPRYFETMGIPIVRGRAIDERDVAGTPLAVVINETMARRYWSGRDPIGGRVDFGGGPAVVVGVARDGKYSRLNEEPRSYTYLSLYQNFRPDALLQVRTTGDPGRVAGAIQRELKALDPSLPLFDLRTVEEHLQLSVFIPRMASTMLGLFGALALLLAVVGLYGVVACSVAERTREIGIRVALGATPSSVIWLIVREGLTWSALGLGVGGVLAFGAGLGMRSLVYQGRGADPLILTIVTVVLASAGLFASWVPARRAARIAPVQAMRNS
jgi:putative ABC transport system permease protein